jgi:methionyl-tRNA synthetase
MKKFYVATAIPYVNDKPHIGHAMDYMLADVLARTHQQMGDDVFFGVGTDEHGTKVAAKAEEAKQTPQEYADSIVPSWHEFLGRINISNTDFIRTTDERHEKAAQLIWKQLEKYIYKSTYEGWYCSGEEAFVTAREAAETNGICPTHKRPYEHLSEENYYFKLSEFGDQIKEALQAGEMKIVPDFRKHEILQLIEKGLDDVSISRPKKHLSWGIEVPNDKDHVMYVWFEAVMNYISILGYPDGENYQKFWPADVQVIGKDILRFHAAIWPAMLIALDIPLPKTLLVHGFVLTGGTKMSKSIGNVVNPIEVIDGYGVDAFRYYFLRHIPTIEDGDFTWDKFENAYNNELGNELGNLVQRVASMITRYQHGVIGELPKQRHDSGAFYQELEQYRFDRALDHLWMKVRELNVYLEEVKPWHIAKDSDEEHLQEDLAYAASGLLQIAHLLWPFLPTTSEVITKIFEGGSISSYHGVLFPKIYKHTPAPGQKPVASPAAPQPGPAPKPDAAH